MRGWAWIAGTVAALGGAALLAGVDTHTDDAFISMGCLLFLSFALGAAWPRGAWAWGLIVGLAVPAAALAAGWAHAATPHPPQPNAATTLVLVVPGLAGAYLGAGARRLLRPASGAEPRRDG